MSQIKESLTDSAEPAHNSEALSDLISLVKAPEVDIATNVLVNEISKDAELQEYCNTYDFMHVLSEHINIELGYELVYMAAEIAIINEFENMTDTYDFKAMRRAVFATRGYLLPSKTIRGCRSRLQEDLVNTQKTKAIYSSLRGQMLTLLILGLVSVYIAARFVANVSLFELLNAMQQSFIGMTVIVYMIAILAAIVYFAFIRQNRRK